ncbi:MAG TPA: Gfo/Idh/MocA family oxidoreductase [Acetobacteraceae bacterium]
MRWGFMGAARIARNALAPAVQAAGHRLEAVAARDRARAEAFAADFAIPRAYEGYDALLADPALDAIYIALPNDAHLPWTLRALEAGKHVLCEKPVALNAAEVERMQAAEAASGRRVMEAYVHIHHPQMARVREIMAEGRLGPLMAMHSSFGNTLRNEGDFRWHGALGGGALLDLGCYCVSAMRVLAGREPVRVAAVQAMRGDVDATMNGLLDFGEGLAGQFLCSFESARTQDLVLIGTQGRLTLDWPFSTRDRATTLDLDGNLEPFPPANAYAAMVTHFAAAVAGEAEMMFPLSASLAQARVHDALRTAATGSWVNVAR